MTDKTAPDPEHEISNNVPNHDAGTRPAREAADTKHPTGEKQAAQNAENEPAG